MSTRDHINVQARMDIGGHRTQLKRRLIESWKVLGQYHTALEHTFLWIIDAEEAHLITDFCVEVKVAKFNELKIVPMITFNEGVVPGLRKIHSL